MMQRASEIRAVLANPVRKVSNRLFLRQPGKWKGAVCHFHHIIYINESHISPSLLAVTASSHVIQSSHSSMFSF